MSNTETAYNFFLNNGFTAAQSAGIVGNLIQESGVNPESVQSGGPGRGIAQWSEGGRWNPALMTGNPSVDLPAQEQYVLDELQQNPSYGLSMLKQATTPTDAAQIFGTNYERYGIAGARVQDAQQVYDQAQTNNWPMASSGTIELTSSSGGGSGGGVIGHLWSAVSNSLFPGMNLVPGLSNPSKAIESLGGFLGFAAQKQPQELNSNGFLKSIDDLLNPSITLLDPWNAITMAMARGGLALFGLALMAAGALIIVFGTDMGRTVIGDTAKAAVL